MPTAGRGLFHWLFCSGARLEDFADRLNHVWTFGLLLVLGAIISWKHGYQDPISCWCPLEFPGFMVRYTHQTCWHSYYIQEPDDDTDVIGLANAVSFPLVRNVVPNDEKKNYTTTYYQWVPFVLCLQSLLFKLPNIILYIFHSYSGVDFDKISGLTSGYENLNVVERNNLANQISRYICRWCKMFPRGLPWRLLTVVWFFIKVMYCFNIIMQMTYIDKFLKTTSEPFDNSTSYGDAIYDNIVRNNGTFWKSSPVFPQKIMCLYLIRQLRNIQTYIVQCDLPANRFTELAYMFLWVWLLFVAVVTTLSFVVWVIMTLLPFGRQRYIRRFLELGDATADGALVRFLEQDVSVVSGLVGEDGVMVLKLVGANSSELLVRDVVCGISRMTHGDASVPSGQILHQQPGAQPLLAHSAPPGPTGVYASSAPPGFYPRIETEKAAP